MKHSLKVGYSFGVTSALITTLGLMVGLYSGTSSKMIVIGGILTIAIADAFSDSLGIHISEEGEGKHTKKQIWESTFSAFFFKFIFTIIFVIPVLLFPLKMAIIFSVFVGFFLLGLFSFRLAKSQKRKPCKIVLEHLFIALVVIVITYYVGYFVSRFFY